MEKDKKSIPGVLSIVQLDKEEIEMLLDYLMQIKPNTHPDFLYTIFEDNFLKFFDVFSGISFKVPSREDMLRFINYIKIYRYCESRGFTSDSIKRASKIFKKRILIIRDIIEKVGSILSEEHALDEESSEN